MSARNGTPSATYLRPNDEVIAERPSPRALIEHGRSYTVESVEMPDSMGYVWLRGIGEKYRPYLLRRAHTG